MGADASHPLTAVKDGHSIMSLTFHEPDGVTVLHLDSAGLSAVRHAIKNTWLPGIQLEQSVCGSGWLFKLQSYPFISSSSKIAQTQSLQMVLRILRICQSRGYYIVCSASLGTRIDRSTLFFTRLPSNVDTPQFLCVSFNQSDMIQFTNIPSHLVDPITDLIRTSWYLGIQKVDLKTECPGQFGVLQFKLAGTPWLAANNEQSVKSKMLLQFIFSLLNRYQWVYHINVNLNRDQDCLIFRHDPSMMTAENHTLCMMTFGQGDRLRLVSTSADTIDFIRKVVEVYWSPGRIQDERKFHGSHEFKISGNPWNSVGEESAKARYLMLKIFQEMFQHGWHKLAGFQLSRSSSDRVVLLFEKREPAIYPMFCIAPHDGDKFWLIDLPTEMVVLFKHILKSRWPNGIQSETKLPLQFGTVYKLQLSGRPWTGGVSNSPVHARSILCSIVEELCKHGWQIMLGADMTSRVYVDPDRPQDVHAFWFIYNSTAAQPCAPYAEGYGMAPSPVFTEPPPTYSEAMKWSNFSGK